MCPHAKSLAGRSISETPYAYVMDLELGFHAVKGKDGPCKAMQ